ncbi:MAG: acetate kinase [Carnobacterium sp.]|uniref:Acetate kinase n=1 Tax=Carnobacterium antarcticum TaxID=2126436 RepID=A0ABW4NN58_9LACT|nr:MULTISPECIES: acetate kinase [unclassified Carnobacterium]ALV20848.1 Acetate kinase [Carnobacterium sp. CP1]QQP71008.1 acetate kinase [Carnobacterium sp. CS13]
MSKTIAINAGSSSLKFTLYEMPAEEEIVSGIIERVGLSDSVFTTKYNGEKYKVVEDIKNHEIAIQMVLDKLIELNVIENYDEITGVGHRVVAGGELFKDSALVTDEVVAQIESLSEFAPLHNPANATGIKAFKKLLPNITSVAVFDTSFHTSMPKENYLYSVPMSYYEDFAARKYGAHGTSHKYVSERAAEMLGKPLEETKLITCHLGNGGSITAVEGGKSVDTSMGFTPLAGITMGTRSGDIDASLLPFLMNKLGITDINEMIYILNNKSGLLGLSDVSSDMRDVEEAAEAGNEQAQTALDIFYNRVQKYIGQYFAVLNGADAIVFTAGIGENSPETRQIIIDGMDWFGAKIDEEANKVRGEERIISTADSKVKVLLIPTNEEIAIARDVERLRVK